MAWDYMAKVALVLLLPPEIFSQMVPKVVGVDQAAQTDITVAPAITKLELQIPKAVAGPMAVAQAVADLAYMQAGATELFVLYGVLIDLSP